MLVSAATTFEEFLRGIGAGGGMRHVVVRQGNRIVGVLRVNAGLRETIGSPSQATMGELAQRNYTIVRTDAVVFDVIARLWRHEAPMGIVVTGRGLPRADKVVGVITKEHIADEVARTVRIYTR